jgi:hypothetical protein
MRVAFSADNHRLVTGSAAEKIEQQGTNLPQTNEDAEKYK